MAKMKYLLFIVLLLIGGTFFFTQKIDPKRNNLVFEDDISCVSDSLKKMEYLLNKFQKPENEIVNYFVDHKGFLYLNSKKLGPLVGAINNEMVRSDVVFKNFSEKVIDDFFNLMAYLWKNHVTMCSREPSINLFTFSYRVKEIETKANDRFIIIVKQKSDTTSFNFKRFYKVIDFKEDLALLGVK